jgi:competence protein ComEC
VNIYNTLGASAFFLLLFDPYMIMSVGFQLSYLAVLGIVYIQPRMYLLWEPKHRFLDEIWKVTTVSIAAQIATSPLGLLYFHQFPNYFMLANLLVIPGSFVVLVGGLAILAFGFWPLLAGLLGWIVTWTIKALNFVVFTIEGFPYSQVNNIFFTPFQAILLAAVLIAVLLLIRQRKFHYMIVTSVLVITLVVSQWHYFIKQDQPKLLVYDVSNHSAIDLVDGGVAVFVADSALIRDEKKINFHIQGARLINQVHATVPAEDARIMRTVPGGKVIRWKNTTILVLENEPAFYPVMKVDYLIVSNNAVRSLEKVLQHIVPGTVILDSSNSFYLASRLQKEAEQLNVTLHSVRHAGSFQKITAL